MDQNARNAELQKFKDGGINILCASDVAARGLDVKGVSHVFNFDTPWHPDDYVHRIGRTGRGGATGRAFTLVADDDLEAIENVEKLQGSKIPEFKLDIGDKAEAEPRAEREPREDSAKPKRGRGGRTKRPERIDPVEVAAVEAPIAEDKPVREKRPAREPRKAAPEARAPVARPAEPSRALRSEPTPRRDNSDAPAQAGDWNGPVPGFLSVSAL